MLDKDVIEGDETLGVLDGRYGYRRLPNGQWVMIVSPPYLISTFTDESQEPSPTR